MNYDTRAMVARVTGLLDDFGIKHSRVGAGFSYSAQAYNVKIDLADGQTIFFDISELELQQTPLHGAVIASKLTNELSAAGCSGGAAYDGPIFKKSAGEQVATCAGEAITLARAASGWPYDSGPTATDWIKHYEQTVEPSLQEAMRAFTPSGAKPSKFIPASNGEPIDRKADPEAWIRYRTKIEGELKEALKLNRELGDRVIRTQAELDRVRQQAYALVGPDDLVFGPSDVAVVREALALAIEATNSQSQHERLLKLQKGLDEPEDYDVGGDA